MNTNPIHTSGLMLVHSIDNPVYRQLLEDADIRAHLDKTHLDLRECFAEDGFRIGALSTLLTHSLTTTHVTHTCEMLDMHHCARLAFSHAVSLGHEGFLKSAITLEYLRPAAPPLLELTIDVLRIDWQAAEVPGSRYQRDVLFAQLEEHKFFDGTLVSSTWKKQLQTVLEP